MNALLLNVPLDEIIRPLSWMLVHSLWQGALVALLLWGTHRWLLRDASSNKRYAVSCLAMIALVAAMGVTLERYIDRASASTAAPGVHSIALVPQIVQNADSSPLAASQSTSDLAQLARTLVVTLWCVGVVLLSLRHTGGWLRLQWLKRRGAGVPPHWDDVMARLSKRLRIRRRVRLCQSRDLDVPAVIGFLKPIVLIPLAVLNELTPLQVEAILAHELAHIRRHDYIVNLIQCALETLLFYHPAVWWMSRQVRAERENCCDDIAASISADPVRYAQALVSLETSRYRSPMTLVPAATSAPLLARINRLLRLHAVKHHEQPRRWLLAPVLTLALLSSPVVLLHACKADNAGAAAADATQKQSEDAEPNIEAGRTSIINLAATTQAFDPLKDAYDGVTRRIAELEAREKQLKPEDPEFKRLDAERLRMFEIQTRLDQARQMAQFSGTPPIPKIEVVQRQVQGAAERAAIDAEIAKVNQRLADLKLRQAELQSKGYDLSSRELAPVNLEIAMQQSLAARLQAQSQAKTQTQTQFDFKPVTVDAKEVRVAPIVVAPSPDGLDAQGRFRIAQLRMEQKKRNLDRVRKLQQTGAVADADVDQAELDAAIAYEQFRVALQAMEHERPHANQFPPPQPSPESLAAPGAPPAAPQSSTGSPPSTYSIIGQIQRPGEYALAGNDTTVSAAIDEGGMPTDMALDATSVTLIRDKKEVLTAPLRSILNHGPNDMKLQPKDLVVVHVTASTTQPSTQPQK